MPVDLSRLRRLANAVRAMQPPPVPVQRVEGRSWYRIENRAAPTADIYLYDMIGEWGITAQDFVNDLRNVTSPSINLRINCEGGEIFDGLAIYESLCQHSAHVTAHVDGLAASAASFIAQAANHRVMAKRSRMMVHDGHGLCIGNAGDMREMAALLDDLSDNIADIYADRSARGDRASWRQTMLGPAKSSDGTWYAAQAAVDAGLADEVSESAGTDDADNSAPARPLNRHTLDMTAFDPTALLNMFREIEEPAPSMPAVLPWMTDQATEG